MLGSRIWQRIFQDVTYAESIPLSLAGGSQCTLSSRRSSDRSGGRFACGWFARFCATGVSGGLIRHRYARLCTTARERFVPVIAESDGDCMSPSSPLACKRDSASGCWHAVRHDRRSADDGGSRGMAAPRRPRLFSSRARTCSATGSLRGRSSAHHSSSSRASRVCSSPATSAPAPSNGWLPRSARARWQSRSSTST